MENMPPHAVVVDDVSIVTDADIMVTSIRIWNDVEVWWFRKTTKPSPSHCSGLKTWLARHTKQVYDGLTTRLRSLLHQLISLRARNERGVRDGNSSSTRGHAHRARGAFPNGTAQETATSTFMLLCQQLRCRHQARLLGRRQHRRGGCFFPILGLCWVQHHIRLKRRIPNTNCAQQTS